MITRRELLKWGLIGGAGLVTGCAGFDSATDSHTLFADTEHDYGFLTEADRVIVAAVVPVMLAGALPQRGADHDTAVRDVVRGVDYAIGLLAEATRDELRGLFDVLGNALGRVVLAGIWSQWSRVRTLEVAEFLEGWRNAYLDLLRQGYQGLHELITAAWYGNPASWDAIGYAGPPQLERS